MPKSFGQWIGMAVTAVVVLGCRGDSALTTALGVGAGALATFFVSLDEQRRLRHQP